MKIAYMKKVYTFLSMHFLIERIFYVLIFKIPLEIKYLIFSIKLQVPVSSFRLRISNAERKYLNENVFLKVEIILKKVNSYKKYDKIYLRPFGEVGHDQLYTIVLTIK